MFQIEGNISGFFSLETRDFKGEIDPATLAKQVICPTELHRNRNISSNSGQKYLLSKSCLEQDLSLFQVSLHAVVARRCKSLQHFV